LKGGNVESLEGLSFAPSDNDLLFRNGVNDSHCQFVKPLYWDDWVLEYFGEIDRSKFDDRWLMLSDFDGDGVSNIIEYYGLDLTTMYRDRESRKGIERRRYLPTADSFPERSTDPTMADLDGDLLLDFFELLYGFDALVADDSTVDSDSDGLTDFEEQKYRTCPFAGHVFILSD